jgi:hypothetical protein
MHPKLEEKINKLKEEENKKISEKLRVQALEHDRKNKQIQAKLPEARVWVESTLFDLIAKKDLEIESYKKQDINHSNNNIKEIFISSLILPNNIPIESIVIAAKETDGLRIRSEYRAPAYHPNDEFHTAIISSHYDYYVQW